MQKTFSFVFKAALIFLIFFSDGFLKVLTFGLTLAYFSYETLSNTKTSQREKRFIYFCVLFYLIIFIISIYLLVSGRLLWY